MMKSYWKQLKEHIMQSSKGQIMEQIQTLLAKQMQNISRKKGGYGLDRGQINNEALSSDTLAAQ
ncbi:MAG: hypothetical protein EZS28_036740, partial [Streblomastix strix]